jgi:hypothetical protein
MKAAPSSPLLGGEDQAAEVVGDEIEVLEVNGFTEGESTTRQTLTVGSEDDCR